ncbi:MAG TPA: hypothetical protein VG125_20765 [Pirellulales bacterium]|nr:hypothetical protein [Pirellulales bacterium]
MQPSLTSFGETPLSTYDLDQMCAVPQALRLRTMHLFGLFVGVVSIAAAIEWPLAWQLVALADLAATSVFFALAAGREWFLRWRSAHRLQPSRFVGVARHRWEYRALQT